MIYLFKMKEISVVNNAASLRFFLCVPIHVALKLKCNIYMIRHMINLLVLH